MIVEGYSMDLYCDYAGPHGYGEGKSHGHFGHNKREAYRIARVSGWRFCVVDGDAKAKCPKCVKAKVKALSTDTAPGPAGGAGVASS